MSLVLPEKFQHILRIMSTNIDGKRKVPIAMTAIKGVGRRYSSVVLKKADVDLNKRAGECTEEEVRFDSGIVKLSEIFCVHMRIRYKLESEKSFNYLYQNNNNYVLLWSEIYFIELLISLEVSLELSVVYF